MNKLFISLISIFIKDYTEEAVATAAIIKSAKRDVKARLDVLAAEKLQPLISTMFSDGIKASNSIYKKEVLKYADFVDVKFKYDREVLSKINDKSVFTGFYDKNYKDLYTKREINNLKNVILQGKYNNLSDRELAAKIKTTINTTKKRALITAREETQRLETAAIDTLLQQKKVSDVWVKKYNYTNDESRQSHKYTARFDSGNGPGIADDDGLFTCEDGSKITGPPNNVSPYNCKCFITLVKKA